MILTSSANDVANSNYPSGPTVALYAAQLIERKRNRKKRPNTVNGYDSHLRNHIVPFAGNRPAASLQRCDSTAFVDYLLEKPSLRSPRTIAQVFKTWRLLMHYMLDENVRLPANIVTRIELPEVEFRNDIALTPGQVAAAAAAIRAIEPRYEVVVWLCACAGLRRGEALGLTWGRVGWAQGCLRIEEQRQRGMAAPLKTKSSYATLPVDHFLIKRLVDHSRRFPPTDMATSRAEPGRLTQSHANPADDGLVVTNSQGMPVQPGNFYRKWHQVVDAAGLPEGTRLHSLKRFYTSILGSSGDHDPKAVQVLSRHARFAETWDTYAQPLSAAGGMRVTAFSASFRSPADAL
ncbi:tyrosine-type recombinase/integrase [Streptomyces mirabilis]|uniref:tyrosine-type recombinase/integrase n=1 Tax=Streptomyces mirabilis TaxID=68239 RepID=UPI0037F459E7